MNQLLNRIKEEENLLLVVLIQVIKETALSRHINKSQAINLSSVLFASQLLVTQKLIHLKDISNAAARK